MIHNKEKLHAIGNYLQERFGLEWRFVDAHSSNPDTIIFDDICVMGKFSDERNKWWAFKETSTGGTRGFLCDSPMQVINGIITRKYEVK